MIYPIKDLSKEIRYKNVIIMYILKTFEIIKNLITKEIKHIFSLIGEIGLLP